MQLNIIFLQISTFFLYFFAFLGLLDLFFSISAPKCVFGVSDFIKN